ncbi:MAG: hypothetical protein AAF389_13135 [Gemmatimonadota bacterium]
MTLLDDLAHYDGTTVAILETIAERRKEDDTALRQAVHLLSADEPHVSAGVSWLIRRWLQDGAALSSEALEEMAAQLSHIGHHWARLHVCQTMAHLDVPESLAPAFATFLRSAIESERPFLRAWGTDGLVRLAEQHPDLRVDARRALDAALSDGSASVRARARRIVDELG